MMAGPCARCAVLVGLALGCARLHPAGEPNPPGSAGDPASTGLGGVVERLPPPPRTPATTYTPGGPPRPTYVAPPLRPDPREPRRLDRFTRALLEAVSVAASEAGVPPPLGDERRHALARDIARLYRTDRPPPSEALRFLIGHHGIVDTDPHILMVRGPDNEPSAAEYFRRGLPRVFEGATWNRVGVGSYRPAPRELTAVVLLWEQYLELEPIPRRLSSGQSVRLRGRFLRPYSNPQLVFTLPGGDVRRLKLDLRGDTFEAELRCSFGDGRYQVEMVAADATGPLVLANFPVFCGVNPPLDVAAHDEEDPADIDPAQAEQEIFALINQDRRSAGLQPLVWDNRLAAIARSHSRDMAENRFVAHVSPTTGDTETRVRRAGGRYTLILENVGQEGGVRQAHQGFMNSPGHRANVLNSQVTFVGIGAVVNHRRGGAPLVVTELFAR